ncbi:MAG: ABC transporter substrate-binding protein [Sulfobacillus sp.]
MQWLGGLGGGRGRSTRLVSIVGSVSVVAVALAACGSSSPKKPQASPQAFTTITIGIQPQRWALPWYIATQRGYWAQVGLKPVIKSFASGPPEIDAGVAGGWDVGGAGDIPSFLGSSKYGLINIAIADREEKILTLMATPGEAAKVLANPQVLVGKTIPMTADSTGQWIAQECLTKKFHLAPSQYHLINLSPPEINAAFSSGKYDVSEVWAPNTYVLESKLGAKVICTGGQVHIPVTSNVFVTPAYAQAHPNDVAKMLAVYEKAIAWEHAHPKGAATYLGAFLSSEGVIIPQRDLPIELGLRPDYTLSQQLQIFRGGPSSEMTRWSKLVVAFMTANGLIKASPNFGAVISSRFLKMIASNTKLNAFASTP